MKRLLLILLIGFSAHFTHAQSRAGSAAEAIVRFYPNPAVSVVTFDFQKGFEKGYSLQVYNFPQGKKVYEAKNMAQRTTINLAEFNRGMYIYQLRDRNGRMVESGKFQVSR